MLDAMIGGSVLFGFGYVALMFAGFFVRTVAPDLAQVEAIDFEALTDDTAFGFGKEVVESDLPAFPGDVEMTAETAVDLGAEFAAVAAYWQCGLRKVQLMEAALAA